MLKLKEDYSIKIEIAIKINDDLKFILQEDFLNIITHNKVRDLKLIICIMNSL